MSDFEKDDFDGALFRFWIRAGSEFPGQTAIAIAAATTPAEYRKALTELAESRRINLPIDGVAGEEFAHSCADAAMKLIWAKWYNFYHSHFRADGVGISAADQEAFYEIAQPIMRSLSTVKGVGSHG